MEDRRRTLEVMETVVIASQVRGLFIRFLGPQPPLLVQLAGTNHAHG
jgi:hypothetical protein